MRCGGVSFSPSFVCLAQVNSLRLVNKSVFGFEHKIRLF